MHVGSVESMCQGTNAEATVAQMQDQGVPMRGSNDASAGFGYFLPEQKVTYENSTSLSEKFCEAYLY